MAKRLAFINGKGGCGKTTSIFHIAGVLSKMGKKVLVIDLDKQGNASFMLLMNNPSLPEATIFDFMLGNAEPDEVTAQALFQTRGNAKPKYYGVDCMVSDVRLENEAVLADVDGEMVGDKLDAFIEKNGYDWVLVDMPPSNLSLNNICFRYLADYAVIPFSTDLSSITGYGQIIDVLDKAREVNPGLNVLGVYLSMYSKWGCEIAIREQLLGLGDGFIDVQIPHMKDVKESISKGRPISYYKMLSAGKSAYEELVNELIRRMER